MPKPSDASAFDLKHHTLAFGLLVEICVGYLVWPEDAADFPEASIVEGVDVLHVTLTTRFQAVGSNYAGLSLEMSAKIPTFT